MGSGTASERLDVAVTKHRSAVVAYSGGVDSALVAFVASRRIRTLAVMSDSPSVPRAELDAARRFAERHSIQMRVVPTGEVDLDDYRRNDGRRCYFCKGTLYAELSRIARDEGYEVVMDGTNLSDLGDVRPGLEAAREAGVVSPLLEAGLAKEDVREVSRQLGLETWNKPSAPCLSSRIPVGLPVTFEALAQVERAEEVLKRAGFRVVRVRHLGHKARIEVGEGERDDELLHSLVPAIKQIGFGEVEFFASPYLEPHLRARAQQSP
ncbi:MAG TPA: ATP-dependent sacrificial sulfur transferase LarE [Thermoplasmata archaeon]|nr:ATP-dependent sacrificial sulfur transferase LarE [Thermoplasmata archaeon]